MLQKSPQEIPRALVVFNDANAIHHVIDFVQKKLGRQSCVAQYEVALIPGRVIAHIGRN